MELEFRTASENDIKEVAAVWREAFRRRLRESYAKGLRAAEEMRQGRCFILLALHKGRIVGAVKNRLEALQIGHDTIQKADVGEVAVKPSLQGRGVGSAMMHRNQEMLLEHGVHLARLGGMCRFYSRFGYSPVPKVRYRCPLVPVFGGVKKIDVKAATADALKEGFSVRGFETDSDAAQFTAMRMAFQKDRTGNIADDTPPVSIQALRADRNRMLCADASGRVLACIHASLRDGFVYDLCYDTAAPEGPAALAMLWADFARRAAKWGRKIIEARLPDDPTMLVALRMSGLPIERVEITSNTVSTQVSILNLAGVFTRIASTLEQRLSEGPAGGVGCKLSVHLTERSQVGSISLGSNFPGAQIKMRISQADFVCLLLGLRSLAEVPGCIIEPDTPHARGIIASLFPRQTGYFF